MPEIGGVEYGDVAFEFMQEIAGQRQTDGSLPGTFANEAAVIHAIHEEFPGVRMLPDADPGGSGEARRPRGSLAGVQGVSEAPAHPDEHPAVFDTEASRAARKQGEAKVERGTDPEWRARAVQAVIEVCSEKETFTADDIWAKVEKPREPRALGPIMSSAVKRGLCEPTGFIRQSKIPVHHQAPVREYRSLVQ